MAELDLENRDPNGINSALGVTFEDVLAEPEAAHSIDCVWKCSHSCYTGGLSCCYKFMTTLCGLCIALYWGCIFACITFNMVWCITPGCKVYNLFCIMLKNLFTSITDAIIGPCCYSCGSCLSRIEITEKK